MRPGVDAILFAVLAVPRCAGFGFGGIIGGFEVFTRFGDLCGGPVAPA
jgi:uncharacterized membrane protein